MSFAKSNFLEFDTRCVQSIRFYENIDLTYIGQYSHCIPPENTRKQLVF